MFNTNYGTRQLIENSQKISANACLSTFLLDTKGQIGGKTFDLNSEADIQKIINEIEATTIINMSQERSNSTTVTDPNRIKMTYTRSNLNKRFIFWFICNLCGKRMKYLYFPPNSTVLGCRNCHRLTYEKQNENKRYRPFRRLLGV